MSPSGSTIRGRGADTVCGPSGSPVAYLPTGQLVFFRGNQLMSAPFELAKTALAASASPVLSEVEQDFVAFSGTGLVTLLHYPLGIRRTIVAVDRSGAYAQIIRESESFRWPRVSHDGRRLAVGRRASQSRGAKVWVFDLDDRGGTSSCTTTGPTPSRYGHRTASGSSTALSGEAMSTCTGSRPTAAGSRRCLAACRLKSGRRRFRQDGRLVALYGQSKANEYGIWTVTLDGQPKPPRFCGRRATSEGRASLRAAGGSRTRQTKRAGQRFTSARSQVSMPNGPFRRTVAPARCGRRTVGNCSTGPGRE